MTQITSFKDTEVKYISRESMIEITGSPFNFWVDDENEPKIVLIRSDISDDEKKKSFEYAVT